MNYNWNVGHGKFWQQGYSTIVWHMADKRHVLSPYLLHIVLVLSLSRSDLLYITNTPEHTVCVEVHLELQVVWHHYLSVITESVASFRKEPLPTRLKLVRRATHHASSTRPSSSFVRIFLSTNRAHKTIFYNAPPPLTRHCSPASMTASHWVHILWACFPCWSESLQQ